MSPDDLLEKARVEVERARVKAEEAQVALRLATPIAQCGVDWARIERCQLHGVDYYKSGSAYLSVDAAPNAVAMLMRALPPVGCWEIDDARRPIVDFRYHPDRSSGIRLDCEVVQRLTVHEQPNGQPYIKHYQVAWYTRVAGVLVRVAVHATSLPHIEWRFTPRTAASCLYAATTSCSQRQQRYVAASIPAKEMAMLKLLDLLGLGAEQITPFLGAKGGDDGAADSADGDR